MYVGIASKMKYSIAATLFLAIPRPDGCMQPRQIKEVAINFTFNGRSALLTRIEEEEKKKKGAWHIVVH